MMLIKKLTLILLFLALFGCTTTIPVHFATQPAGGQIAILETGDVVDHNSTLMLPKGNYTLVAHDVARPVPVSIRLEGKQQIDAVVPLGPGLFQLSTQHSGATVKVVELNKQ